MDFRQIFGHKAQLESLRADLESGNLAHAYLFAGPEDVGKFTVAKAFAKMLQSDGLPEEEAVKLHNMIDRGGNLDTIFLARGEEGESIKIEQIKQLLQNLQMTGNGNYRVLVIEEIERMTDEAGNAMLKMIEEPPSAVRFVFTSSQPDRILETILSRVRRVDFQKLSEGETLAALQSKYRLATPERRRRAAELSLGKIAKAMKLMEDDALFEAYENIYRQIRDFLLNKKVSDAFALIADIHDDKALVKMMIDIAFVILREDMKNDIMPDVKEKVRRLEALFEVKRLSTSNVNYRLLLENFVLNL